MDRVHCYAHVSDRDRGTNSLELNHSERAHMFLAMASDSKKSDELFCETKAKQDWCRCSLRRACGDDRCSG